MLAEAFTLSNYHWNPYAIPQIICTIYFAVMGIFVLLNNSKSKVNISFFLFCISVFMWQCGTMMMLLSNKSYVPLFWSNFLGTGVVFIATTCYIFAINFLRMKSVWFKYFIIAGSTIFAILCNTTNLILATPRYHFFGYNFVAGRWHPFFLIFFGIVMLRFWYAFFKEYRKALRGTNPLLISQMKYVFFGFTALICASVDYAPMYLEEPFYPFGVIFVFIFTTLISYAIIRHRLMDIAVVIRRGILGAVALALLLFVHTMIINLTQQYLGYVLSSFMSMLVIIGLFFSKPVRNRLQRIFDRFVYQGRYGYQEVLKRSAKALVSILQLDALLNYLVTLIVDSFDTKRVAVFLIQEGAEEYVIAASHGIDKNIINRFVLNKDSSIINWFKSEKSVFVKEEKEIAFPESEFNAVYQNLAEIGAKVIIPIFYKEKLRGIITLDNKGFGAMYAQQDLDMLNTLADEAAVAIENAYLYEEAITDGLTRVYHHKYFILRLKEELSRSRRYKHPLSLIMLDVDHFKLFNDKYGHLAGDEVLKSVADLIKKNTRESDVVARYGGEEFVILLPETPLEGAKNAGNRIMLKLSQAGAVEVAEQIRKNVELYKFVFLDKALQITASLGVAEFDGQGEGVDITEFISRADKALYKAKELGRNRIEISG